MMALLFLVLLFCSLKDIGSRRLPAPLIWLLLSMSLVWPVAGALIDGQVWQWQQLLWLLLWFLLLLPGFLFKVFGAADIKIILILALISPFELLLHALLLAFAGIALWWLLRDRKRREYPFIPFLTLGFGVSLWMHGALF